MDLSTLFLLPGIFIRRWQERGRSEADAWTPVTINTSSHRFPPKLGLPSLMNPRCIARLYSEDGALVPRVEEPPQTLRNPMNIAQWGV